MSVRGIGEGHRSSIGFRTGVIDAAGRATIDDPTPFATAGTPEPALLDTAVFRSELARLDDAGETADYVLDRLGQSFTRATLDQQLSELQAHLSTRGHAEETIYTFRSIAERTYAVEFGDQITLSERVLWPSMGAEQGGMEDARFVRFIDDDGSVTFCATYTAYSGSHISQQLLATTDFQSFTSTPIVGPAAANKGLALFPRRIRRSLRSYVEIRSRIEYGCLLPSSVRLDEDDSLPEPDPSLGGVTTRELRFAHRNRRRVAGAHSRRRPDAHLLHRGDSA